MTYSAWLTEVDAAFLKAGRTASTQRVSPTILLREYEKGTSPEDFVKLPQSAFFEDPMSSPSERASILGNASSGVFEFFEDTSVLNSLNRTQAAFVVRFLNAIGWLMVGIAVFTLLTGTVLLAQSFGTTEPIPLPNPDLSKKTEVTLTPDRGGIVLTYLAMSLSAFATGVLFWWGSAILRGFYFMLGRNQTPP